MCGIFLYYLFLFYSLVRNENIKRPDLYVKSNKGFLEFYTTKTIKIMNMGEYCDLIELPSAWVGDPR